MLLLTFFFISIAADLFFFPTSSDIRYLLIIGFWLVLVRIKHFKSEATFKLALGILAFLFLFFVFARTSPITEKLATWIYLLLWVGIIQQFLELRNLPKKANS